MSIVAPSWWPAFASDPFPGGALSPDQFVCDAPKVQRAQRAKAAEPCGPWKLTEAELDALDWAMELDKRAARQLVRQDALDAKADADYHEPWERFAGGSVAGLVSVPTSGRMPRRLEKRTISAVEMEKALSSLDAFLIDKQARRLAMLRRSVGFAARASNVSERATPGEECLMVTTTYDGTNEDWQPRHISEFMKKVRRWLESRGMDCRYVWVAELQGRGVIHYHVALWVPQGVRLPLPDLPYMDKAGRQQPPMWPHGMTRIEVARAAVPYLLKYLSKQTSKTFGEFPRGARIYGVGGLDHAARRARRWLALPAFVQGNSSMYDQWTRAPRDGLRRGGWLSPSGEHFVSEFTRVQVGGRDALKRVCRHARSLREFSVLPEEDGRGPSGPFAWLSDRPKVREVWGRA